MPTGSQVTVSVEDSHGDYIFSKRIPLRRNGSFDASIKLPENSPPGKFSVLVSDINHLQLSDPIPILIERGQTDLKLEWIEAKKDFTADSVPTFIVKARYQNGLPVSNFRAHFNLLQKPYIPSYQKGAITYSFRKSDLSSFYGRVVEGLEDLKKVKDGEEVKVEIRKE